ncbi:hypothetical protein A3B01_02260 [Candidatus Nomurabacteria bacterium RIFCSPLOWO2_01_FULL_41_52b]|nr:MAG: hypothetical protein A3B01_02260 [Candidatus Nomurabacteria bacterium RIFCSPLOWO2_01_FULL_41_52b]
MKIQNADKPTFSSPDFYLCAFLKAKELKLLGVEKESPSRLLFVFQDSKDRQELVQGFLFDSILIEPKRYATAIRELKDLIHSQI